MRRDGVTIAMPPNPAPYLVDWWLDVGPVAGDQPVGWADLATWGQITGIAPDPWEARTIRAMSAAFLTERHAARKADCPPPFQRETRAAVEDRVARQFKAMLQAFGPSKAG